MAAPVKRRKAAAVTRKPATTAADITWSVVTLAADEPDAEAISDWARGAFGVEPVELRKPESRRVWIELYFENDVAALLAARAAAHHPRVRAHAVRLCRPRDWQRFWRHHFHAFRIGRLRIVPAWERRGPVRGAVDVVVDPGLSFGTGSHFTTRFCLERIEALCRRRPPADMLDAGAGSAILAIAAAKLGVRHALATDFDPLAVDQARANVRLNRVVRRVKVECADILEQPPKGRFALVCANLYGPLLMRVAGDLARVAAGPLVLSGIREAEGDAVAAVFEAQGFAEEIRDGDGEWCGMQLRRSDGATR